MGTLLFYFALRSKNRIFIAVAYPVGLLCEIVTIGILARMAGKI